jgi:ribosomal RNA-processing protein 8
MRACSDGLEKVSKWPSNPLDAIIDTVRTRAQRSTNRRLVVADCGCGDARLARELTKLPEATRPRVHSFDLRTDARRGIVAANLAHLPLQTASADVVVFCLSLMGTDWPAFISCV